MKKRYLFPIAFLGILFFGPKAEFQPVDGKIQPVDIPLSALDAHIAAKEAKVENIKPNNESRIVWADSIRKTEYAVVYLHGFSASIWEGDALHTAFAKRYGANLYLARQQDHGIDDSNTFKNLTPKNYMDSAKEAIAIGQLIGEKVILMSCSTGGTHSIYLTANNPEMVHAQILYSPNIAIANPAVQLATMPWGKQIVGTIVGEYVKSGSYGKPEMANYATIEYHSNGIIALEDLLEQTMMPETFQKIKSPYFLGYFYKNEEVQDPVVSVAAMREMDKQTQTPDAQKHNVPFADVNNHVICSSRQSDDYEAVRQATYQFAEEVLRMVPTIE
ncbi:MAG: alpha/beta hydrolase [Bacteroidota bacterium]